MRGIKVQGHASMMRSSSCPGAIVSTDTAAGLATLRGRQNVERQQEVIATQASQIEQLSATVALLANHLGIEVPTGGDDVNSGGE